MLVGGTGITPMIQALHAILGDPASSTRATMLYGSRVKDDILGQELLDQWSSGDSSRLSVTHVLSHEPEDSDWKGPRGHIGRELISKHMPGPDDEDGIIFICGPPPMYDALCGPRDSKELSGLLAEMGYKAEQVYKF
jgi:cytochrome-b5 reductase